MLNVVCDYLTTSGFEIQTKPIFQQDLFQADQVMVTNSLMGAVPVLSLDKNQLGTPSDLYKQINKYVL